jgi:hypothetical protein
MALDDGLLAGRGRLDDLRNACIGHNPDPNIGGQRQYERPGGALGSTYPVRRHILGAHAE